MRQLAYSVSIGLLVGVTTPAFSAFQNIKAHETTEWTDKLLSAIPQDQSCSAASSDAAFVATSARNIFVGRVLQKVYNVSDFVVSPPNPKRLFYRANEIATLLQAGTLGDWNALGTADDQGVLDQSKQAAESGKLVVAVWQNPESASPGHVAFIGPGPLTPSATWGLNTPVSASLVLNQPQKDFLGQPPSCAFGADKKSAVHIWVKGS